MFKSQPESSWRGKVHAVGAILKVKKKGEEERWKERGGSVINSLLAMQEGILPIQLRPLNIATARRALMVAIVAFGQNVFS